jgi:hypothetical protein
VSSSVAAFYGGLLGSPLGPASDGSGYTFPTEHGPDLQLVSASAASSLCSGASVSVSDAVVLHLEVPSVAVARDVARRTLPDDAVVDGVSHGGFLCVDADGYTLHVRDPTNDVPRA